MKIPAFILAAFLCGAALAHEHGEQWTLASRYPAASPQGEGDEDFAKRVATATEGRIEIVTMPAGKLGYQAREQLDAVAKGHTAMADTPGGALGEVEPVFDLSSLPFLAASPVEARKLYEAARPSYETAFERHNQKLLYATPLPPIAARHAIPLSFTTVNLDRWKSLDSARRAAIENEAAATERRRWKALELRVREEGSAKDPVVSPAVRQQQLDEAREEMRRWAERVGPESREILERR